MRLVLVHYSIVVQLYVVTNRIRAGCGWRIPTVRLARRRGLVARSAGVRCDTYITHRTTFSQPDTVHTLHRPENLLHIRANILIGVCPCDSCVTHDSGSLCFIHTPARPAARRNVPSKLRTVGGAQCFAQVTTRFSQRLVRKPLKTFRKGPPTDRYGKIRVFINSEGNLAKKELRAAPPLPCRMALEAEKQSGTSPHSLGVSRGRVHAG